MSEYRPAEARDFIGPGTGEPARYVWSVTPSDTEDLLRPTRAIRCGGAGDLAVKTITGETVTIPSVVAGETLVIRAVRVYSTNTTATEIVGMA